MGGGPAVRKGRPEAGSTISTRRAPRIAFGDLQNTKPMMPNRRRRAQPRALLVSLAKLASGERFSNWGFGVNPANCLPTNHFSFPPQVSCFSTGSARGCHRMGVRSRGGTILVTTSFTWKVDGSAPVTNSPRPRPQGGTKPLARNSSFGRYATSATACTEVLASNSVPSTHIR